MGGWGPCVRNGIGFRLLPTPVSASLIYRYKFNEAAGSATTIADSSGNGFDAVGQANYGRLPAFTGNSIRLDRTYNQYLRIDPDFGRVLQAQDSFSVTASIKLVNVRAVHLWLLHCHWQQMVRWPCPPHVASMMTDACTCVFTNPGRAMGAPF